MMGTGYFCEYQDDLNHFARYLCIFHTADILSSSAGGKNTDRSAERSFSEDRGPIFCGGLPGDPLEHPGKIIRVHVPHSLPHLFHIDRRLLQQPFRLLDPVLGQIGGEILVEALLEQLAEIGL